jgi:hypothetical protein
MPKRVAEKNLEIYRRTLQNGTIASLPIFGADMGAAHLEHIH